MPWRIIVKTRNANPNKNRKNNWQAVIKYSALLVIFEKRTNTTKKRLAQKRQRKKS